MTLKGFHIFFILVATTLVGYFGYWALASEYFATATGSFISAAALVIYGILFYQKIKV